MPLGGRRSKRLRRQGRVEDGGTSAQRHDAAVQCDTRAGLRPAPTDEICCMGGIFCTGGICWPGVEG